MVKIIFSAKIWEAQQNLALYLRSRRAAMFRRPLWAALGAVWYCSIKLLFVSKDTCMPVARGQLTVEYSWQQDKGTCMTGIRSVTCSSAERNCGLSGLVGDTVERTKLASCWSALSSTSGRTKFVPFGCHASFELSIPLQTRKTRFQPLAPE